MIKILCTSMTINCYRDPQILCSGFDRPNLYFIVHMKGSNILSDIREYMQDTDGSTIIYCITKKHTEEVADLLNCKCFICEFKVLLLV